MEDVLEDIRFGSPVWLGPLGRLINVELLLVRDHVVEKVHKTSFAYRLGELWAVWVLKRLTILALALELQDLLVVFEK